MDTGSHPHVPKIGMRMIKTAIATLICGLLGYVRNQVPFYSIITSILCMQPNQSKSVQTAADRVIGTAIGGAAGILFVYIVEYIGMKPLTPLYYLIVSILIIPLIYINLLIKRKDASQLTCVVFLAIAITNPGDDPLWYSVNRILDTLIGIGVGLGVNMLLPHHGHIQGGGDGEPHAVINTPTMEQIPVKGAAAKTVAPAEEKAAAEAPPEEEKKE